MELVWNELSVNSNDDGIDQAVEELRRWLLSVVLERVLKLKSDVERFVSWRCKPPRQDRSG